MSVYVDNLIYPSNGIITCHMLADTSKELLDMAKTINLSHKDLQNPGTPVEHFDIDASKRALALQHGARVASKDDVLALVRVKRAVWR